MLDRVCLVAYGCDPLVVGPASSSKSVVSVQASSDISDDDAFAMRDHHQLRV